MGNLDRKDIKIAYSGIEGAFAEIATKKIFPEAETLPCKSFKAAYDAVVNGDAEAAVLPIENSYAGEVGQVMDLMFDGDLKVNGIFSLKVRQNLLVVPGTKLSDIKTVISHPQALDQCAEYISEHGFETEQATNTARAAKQVADDKDKSKAAIASVETAQLYGLDVLAHDINGNNTNTTKFVVVSKYTENIFDPGDFISYAVMFVVKNEAGSLGKAVQVFGDFGGDLRVLRSRPLKDRHWEYYFYTEVGGIKDKEYADLMFAVLKTRCEEVKILGSYPKHGSLG